jgi:hypothetical protein
VRSPTGIATPDGDVHALASLGASFEIAPSLGDASFDATSLVEPSLGVAASCCVDGVVEQAVRMAVTAARRTSEAYASWAATGSLVVVTVKL